MIASFFDVYLLVVNDQTYEALVRTGVVSHGVRIHHAFFFPLSQAKIRAFWKNNEQTLKKVMCTKTEMLSFICKLSITNVTFVFYNFITRVYITFIELAGLAIADFEIHYFASVAVAAQFRAHSRQICYHSHVLTRDWTGRLHQAFDTWLKKKRFFALCKHIK